MIVFSDYRALETGKLELRGPQAILCLRGGDSLPHGCSPRPRADLQGRGGPAHSRGRSVRGTRQNGPRHQTVVPGQGFLPLILDRLVLRLLRRMKEKGSAFRFRPPFQVCQMSSWG